jgi:uncharacterized membrane protein
MLSFSHPGYLLLLLLVPGLVWISRRSLADLRPGRARLALALRLVIALLLIAALAGLQVARPSKNLCVYFILDQSDSIPRERQEAAIRFINDAAARMGPNDTAGVIVFGSDAYVEYLPRLGLKVGTIHTVLSRQYTDIASAIRLALAAFPDDARKRIVLLSDGNENMGSAVDEAAGAASASVQIDVVPIRYEYDKELLLEKMIAPAEVKQGEPFELKVIASTTYDTTARLRVWADDRLIGEQRLRLSKGKTPLSIPQTLVKPGFHRFEAQIEGTPDTIPENNRAMAFTQVQGRPQVLYVEGNREDGRYLARALQAQKVDVVLRSEDQIPTNLAEFQNFDSVVISNVGAWKLSPDQMKMIQSNVRDLGAGLVMIGGEYSFGAGGYGGTPIEAALPVDMDVQKKKSMPSGAVAMVMHSCEFPDGNRWAAETAAAVIDVLGARDYVGVLLYDTGERWGIPLQRAGNKEALKQQVFQLQPGDMPSFDAIVRLAYDGLRGVNAQVKHIVILSDGDPSPPTDALMKACVKAKITISTIAVFPHDTLAPTLAYMAKVGRGRFYRVMNAAQIPRIFLKEATYVLKPAIIEEPFLPKSDPASPFLKGIATASIPPLLGYVAATPKPLADLAMLTKRDDPLLASWQYGLGKAVAFTSDAKNRWAAQWVDWPEYAKLWAQIVRWTVRSTARTPLETTVDITRRQGRVTIDALDERGQFMNFLDLKGNVVTPERTLKLSMQQTAPGRYEGTFDAPDIGQYIVSVGYRDAQGRQRLHTAGAAVPYSPEYRELKANDATLTRLGESTGGLLYPALGTRADLDPKQAVFRHDQLARTAPQEVWPLLLLLAALLFPADVAVRRLMIERAEALAYARQGWERVRSRLPTRRRRAGAREESFDRLLARKGRVSAHLTPDEEAALRAQEASSAAGRATGTPSPAPAEPATRPSSAPGAVEAPAPQVVWNRPVPGITPGEGQPSQPREAPAPRPGPAPSRETPAAPATPEPTASADSTPTSRLLRAKRRAAGAPGDDEPGPDESKRPGAS